ncbi:hypothetical protein [Streptomyces sp. NPDC001604]|uniref:hypothetical protein n=1 Tax=Streptomyces sp. NPDC001604 TaxID=3364593 RepID=UPI0036892C0A
MLQRLGVLAAGGCQVTQGFAVLLGARHVAYLSLEFVEAREFLSAVTDLFREREVLECHDLDISK